MEIKCPECGVTYPVDHTENHLVACMDCGTVYNQKENIIKTVDCPEGIETLEWVLNQDTQEG